MQAEYLDAPERSADEMQSHYDWLNRVNGLMKFERPFRIWIPRLLGQPACRKLNILDVGAGDGMLGRTLSAWAQKQGWEWNFTDLDLSTTTSTLNPNPRTVVGSATALPFDAGSFDVVIANMMTHHIVGEENLIRHVCEAHRVSGRLVLFCDMQRNLPFLAMLGSLLWLWRAPKDFREDALISVRRGWRLDEWRRLATVAGYPDARTWREHGTRILLSISK